MKIASNYPVIQAWQPARPEAPPAAAATPVPTSVILGKIFPIKLPGGIELTAAGAQALGLGMKFGTPGPTTRPAPVPGKISPGASTACYVSPLLAAQRSTDPKLIEGVRNFTSLIAANCGTKIKLAHDTAWLGHDFIVFYRDLNDPEVKQTEHLVSLGELGSGVFAVLAGILHKPWLDQTSTGLHVTALVGGHLCKGRLAFSQSEYLELSSAPGAEEYSKIVALTEFALPSP